MTIYKETDDRDAMYNEYLDNHIGGVKRSYQEILRPYIMSSKTLTLELMNELDRQIDSHDQSKYSEEEWEPYLDHFYPTNTTEYTKDDDQNSKAYDLAWLHHQKNNSHHWQYWILVKDSPKDGNKYVPIEMDTFAVYEMLCDWSSFQYTRPGSTANQWYKDNKDNMILHDNTRELIEEVLKDLPEL